MSRNDLTQIKKELMKNFILCLMAYPAIMTLLLLMSIDKKEGLRAIVFMFISALLLFGIVMLIYNVITSKLQKLIDEKTDDEDAVRFARKLPATVTALFLTPLLSGGFAITLLSYYKRMLITPWQVVFFLLLGFFLALSLAMFHYYRFKIILYPVSSAVNIRSLSMFEKLLAPILSFIIITLLFVGIGIYSVNVTRTIEFYKSNMISRAEKTAEAIDDTFNNIEIELQAGLNFAVPETMTQNDATAMAKKLYDSRQSQNIETLFLVKNSGQSFTNRGNTPDLKERAYFKQGSSTKATAWSDLIQSKDTGSNIIVCFIPKIINGNMWGGVGATINAQAMESIVNSGSTTSETKFLIMNTEGKIIYHPEERLLNKVLGKDLLDKNGKDLNAFIRGEDTDFHEYVINNKPLMLRKIKLKSTGHFLVSTSYESELMKPVNSIVLRVIIGMLFIYTVVFIILYRTGKSFSTPIRNTIKVFKKLAEGDLTARTDDYLPDEFGDMIRNMKKFQDKISEVVDSALNSSNQLAASAEQLSATSSSLADSAQTQARAGEQVTVATKQVMEMSDNISNSTHEQTITHSEISKTMDQINEQTQQQASGAEEIASSAEEISAQAESMKSLLEFFTTGRRGEA